MEAALVGPLGRTIIGPTKVTIGRAPDNTIVLSDPRASSHHAEVRPEGASFSVVDLGSSNGTFVNEQQVFGATSRLLQPGDAVRIGDTRFMFEMANVSQSYAGGSTMRATPPPPPPAAGAASNFAGNTSYGLPENYGGYQGTIPAQSAYIPPQQPLSPYASETQMPTYVSSTGQQPSYTPSQSPNYTPLTGQQPLYTPPSPIYNPPPAPPQKRPPTRAIMLAVIALVIILVGIGGFFIVRPVCCGPNTNATATANANGTTIAHTNATATARALASSTPPTPTIPVSPYPSFTALALSDTLQTNSASQWGTGAECQFSSSGYQVSLAQQGYFKPCIAANTSFTDFAYQVDMVIRNGDCGGLIFRVTGSGNSLVYYVFQVCRDGTYSLFVQQNSSESNLLSSSSLTSSNIKQELNQQNVIAVAVQGSSISLYVNDVNTPIQTITDTSNFSKQGAIGVMAYAANSPTTVTFTNALVWTQSS